MKNFIDICDLNKNQIDKIITNAKKIKKTPNKFTTTCKGKVLGMVFENIQPSATKEIKYNRILVIIMASVPLFFLIISANATNTLSSIMLIDSFLIVFSPALFYLGLVWYRGRILVSNELLQMIIVGVLGAVVVALMRCLNVLDRHSDDLSPLLVGEAIAVGVLGILYGSFALSVAAFCSFTKTFLNVRFVKLNWHLLEIFALWILMVFAPLVSVAVPYKEITLSTSAHNLGISE